MEEESRSLDPYFIYRPSFFIEVINACASFDIEYFRTSLKHLPKHNGPLMTNESSIPKENIHIAMFQEPVFRPLRLEQSISYNL